MKSLYAPWRETYSGTDDKSKEENITPQDCVFCTIGKENADKENFILKRGAYSFVVLNKYPYNAGHLLVIPYEHAQTLHQLSPQARTELIELVNESLLYLKDTVQPDGNNVGLNLGAAAGAGIPSHLHFHVLPRWKNDTNFLPTLAHTKVISFNLEEIYQKLLPAFKV